ASSGGYTASRELSDLPVTKAVDEVVIDHTDGLHVRVNDRRAYEAEGPALEVLAHGVRLGAVRRDLLRLAPAVLDRATVDEAPLVGVEAAELLLDVEKRLRVLDRRFDLRPVAHDARVRQQRRDLPLVVAGDLPWIEAVEGAPVGVALAEDRAPAQPRLRPLEDEELEEDAILVHGDAPFLAVVGEVERIGARPGASFLRGGNAVLSFLVLQGLDGVEARCLARRVQAEADADEAAEQDRHDEDVRPEQDRPAEVRGELAAHFGIG